MLNELIFLNFFFLFFFFLLLTRSWGYVGMLLIVEGLWVLLYCLFISVAPSALELSFFMVALLILTLSAVELVLGLLCFVIFYHTVNAVLPTSGFKSKLTSFYEAGFSGAMASLRKFF